MYCEDCPNYEECKEFALNMNENTNYKDLSPNCIREIEWYLAKCKANCQLWKSGGVDYYRNKLNEEIGKSLYWMSDIKNHIEAGFSYLKNNITIFCTENEKRKIFVSELNKLNNQKEEQPFQIDRRLTTDEARKMFQAFERLGFLTIHEGRHYVWNKSKLALSVFADGAIKHLKLTGRKTWSVFENLFIAYNPEEYNTESLQAYYKTHAEAQDGNLKHKYETDDDCKQIRKEFARNNF